VKEVEAFRPAYISPEVPPRAVLAGTFIAVEQGCKMLRERLGVQVTGVSRITSSFRATLSSDRPGDQ
jgi:hypothetical protein